MRLALSALLLVLTASHAHAQRRADSVSLRFKWPPGMTAQVDEEWVRVQSTTERRDSITIRSHYRMRVLDHADGLLIAADSFVVSGTSGLPALRGQASDVQRLVTVVESYQPSYVVSRDGEFRSLGSAAQMKRLLDSLLVPMLREIKEAPAELQAVIRNATSEQSMSASAAQEWDAIVGTWVGADWVIGQALQNTVEEPVPVMPGLKIPMRYEFGAAERVPCAPEMRPATCVRLEMYSEPDTASLRRVIAEMVTRLGASEKDKDLLTSLQNLRTMNELIVITEPGTLRPYAVTRVRRVQLSVAPGTTEKAGTTTRVDTRTARYRYAP